MKIIGDRAAVSQRVRSAWERAESITAHNTRITVWVAFKTACVPVAGRRRR